MKLIYREPQPISDKVIMNALKQDNVDYLRILPIDLAFNHDNWRFIQDICVRLSENDDPTVRANALLGLAYAARFKGKVEKTLLNQSYYEH